MQNAKCETRNAKRETRNAKRETRNAKRKCTSVLPLQTDSLAHISPALLATAGVLAMSGGDGGGDGGDVGWRMELASWLDQRTAADGALLRALCDAHMEAVVGYVHDGTQPPVLRGGGGGRAGARAGGALLHRGIRHSEENMVATFTTLMEVSHSHTDGGEPQPH